MKQTQKTGTHSNAIQIGTVIIGKEGFEGLSDLVAEKVAQNMVAQGRLKARSRIAALTQRIWERLKGQPGLPLEVLEEPANQEAIFQAQHAYAVSGDENLAKILVELVADTLSEPPSSLSSIILREAIKTMPLLTIDQVRHVGVNFAALHMEEYVLVAGSELVDLDSFFGAILDGKALTEMAPVTLAHLQSSKVISLLMQQLPFDTYMGRYFAGLIQMGKEMGGMDFRFGPGRTPMDYVEKSKRTGGFQLKARSIAQILEAAKDEPKDIREGLYYSLLDRASDTRVNAEIDNIDGSLKYLRDGWDIYRPASLQLTTIGMAIGHSYVRSRVPDVPDLKHYLDRMAKLT